MKRKIALIASGGDAVGINSAILPLVQQAESVLAFHGGYDGIIHHAPFMLNETEVRLAVASNRNVLRSARSQLAWQPAGRASIRRRLRELDVDLLLVFGGGGSLQAARCLQEEGQRVVLIPMTVDNDIPGLDDTLGFSSAVGVIAQALDQLHGTAHNMPGRIYLLEAFGAGCGHLALSGALAGAAHAVLIPEIPPDMHWLQQRLRHCLSAPFGYGIVVCAEGVAGSGRAMAGSQGGAVALGQQLEASLDVPVRYTLPGYCQRAATPVTADRLLASASGQQALQLIQQGESGLVIGMARGQTTCIRLQAIAAGKRQPDPHLVVAARNLQMIN